MVSTNKSHKNQVPLPTRLHQPPQRPFPSSHTYSARSHPSPGNSRPSVCQPHRKDSGVHRAENWKRLCMYIQSRSGIKNEQRKTLSECTTSNPFHRWVKARHSNVPWLYTWCSIYAIHTTKVCCGIIMLFMERKRCLQSFIVRYEYSIHIACKACEKRMADKWRI